MAQARRTRPSNKNQAKMRANQENREEKLDTTNMAEWLIGTIAHLDVIKASFRIKLIDDKRGVTQYLELAIDVITVVSGAIRDARPRGRHSTRRVWGD